MSIKNVKQVCQRILCTGENNNEIAQLLGIGYNTVKRYRAQVTSLGLQWKDLEGLTEEQVAIVFNKPAVVKGRFVQPDWACIHKEMGRKGVTLRLLHEEYLGSVEGKKMSESAFRRAYKQYKKRIAPSMRQERSPGEALFLDYSGKTLFYYPEGQTKPLKAQIFVATIGYSSKVFVQATASQSSEDWCHSVDSAMQYYGVAPTLLVPDNLKAAIIKNKPGEPVLVNKSFDELANHYECLVAPARPRKPKDKSTVENHVRIIQQTILARLRNHRFKSLGEINAAILPLLDILNNKVMRSYKKSRNQLFEEIDRPNMKPLPRDKFSHGTWKNNLKVPSDYHVRIGEHYYSVPHGLIGDYVDCKMTSTTVEVHHHKSLTPVAVHPRSTKENGATTKPEHRPSNHRHSTRNKLKVLQRWANSAGEHIELFIEKHAENSRSINNTLLAGVGLRKLERNFSRWDLNLACQWALDENAISIEFVRSILEKGIHKKHSRITEPASVPKPHGNIRGREAYVGGVH